MRPYTIIISAQGQREAGGVLLYNVTISNKVRSYVAVAKKKKKKKSWLCLLLTVFANMFGMMGLWFYELHKLEDKIRPN